MKRRIQIKVNILLILMPFCLQGQMTFQEIKSHKNFYSGIPTAMSDVNGDGVDDILILDQGKYLWIAYSSGNSTFYWKEINTQANTILWSINVADLDRNGYQDIILAGSNDGVQIHYQYPTGFIKINLDDALFFSQSSNVYDINKDGWLDYTLCDDNAETKIFINRNGILHLDTQMVQLKLVPQDMSAGNYGCLWSDLDLDGDADLYISKCRSGIDDPKDKRRINLYYENLQRKFVERGAERGIDCSDQSWTTVNGDINGDGLLDLIVVNHYTPSNVYLQNNHGQFEDFTIKSGLDFKGVPIQAALKDWDNDGDLDLLFSGTATELWLNLGDGRFVEEDTNLDKEKFSSFAVGDINMDGYWDLYASYADLLNYPNNRANKIWKHSGGHYHWLMLTLKGQQSNPQGIGCIVHCYVLGKKMIREILAGESFGIQNSLNAHFGLGSADHVDSISILWPSGNRDIYYDIKPDQYYLAEEGKCISPRIKIISPQETVICKGDSIESKLDTNYLSHFWSNGNKEKEITVSKEGIYFCKALDHQLCSYLSQSKLIEVNPKEFPKLNYNYEYILCDGDYIDLEVPTFENIKWWNGDRKKIQRVNESGFYFASVNGKCETFYTDTLHVIKNEFIETPKIKSDTLWNVQSTVLTADRDQVNWYNNGTDLTPVFQGKNYEISNVTVSTMVWAESYENIDYNGVHGGMEKPIFVNGAYTASFLNPDMYFNAYRDFILDSCTVFTDRAGIRRIELKNEKDSVIQFREVMLTEGKNKIHLNFNIKKYHAYYKLGTNVNSNQMHLGINSPRLERSNTGFYYPFFIQDLCRIYGNSISDTYYYSFFDWVIKPINQQCISERISVPIVLITKNDDLFNSDFCGMKYDAMKSILHVECDKKISYPLNIKMLDVHGRCNFQSTFSNEKVELQKPLAGIYFIQMWNSKQRYSYKIIIEE